MVERVDSDMIENYGVADLGGKVGIPFTSVPLKGLVEKPSYEEAPSSLAVLGRYILPAKVMHLLEETEIGVGGEIQLTDALDKLLKIDGLNALATDADVYDCGNKQGFLCANMAMGLRDPETKPLLKKLIERIGV
jgi:UTP--glucose-1-phosphate uridylyltransferase